MDLKIRRFYDLKKVERACSVMSRKESSAEHSWSCLILADYFLSQMEEDLDRLKIYELLMYHDVVEIETGDIDLLDENSRLHKKEVEEKAMHVLKEKIPAVLSEKFLNLFMEFEAGETQEAKFARAIDALDAEIHELDYKEDWKGWTEEFLRKKKGPLFEEFPALKEAFEQTTAFAKENAYFD
jgi:putative hydrolases of HD superfamily